MIETGLKELDKFLDGGIKDGLITSISGQSATGKTQLVFQICLNALHNGKEVLFQDTTGEFRPERLVEMMHLQKISPSLLDKIKVNRVTNTTQQIQGLSKTSLERYSLIIVTKENWIKWITSVTNNSKKTINNITKKHKKKRYCKIKK